MTDAQPPRPPLHRSYTRWWLAGLTLFVVTEGAALARGRPGGMLTDHVRAIQWGWAGVAIYAVLAWIFLYHFPLAGGRPFSWRDGVAVAIGVAWWALCRWLYMRGTVL